MQKKGCLFADLYQKTKEIFPGECGEGGVKKIQGNGLVISGIREMAFLCIWQLR
jgi:hypothetical protein